MQRWSVRYLRESILKLVFLLTLTVGAACSHSQSQPAGPAQFLFVTLPETRSVAIFATATSGDAKPIVTIRESAPDRPIDAGVNLRGEIFIGNSNGTINIFAGRAPDYQLVRTIAGPRTQIIHPSSMAVDPTGNIYVADLGATP